MIRTSVILMASCPSVWMDEWMKERAGWGVQMVLGQENPPHVISSPANEGFSSFVICLVYFKFKVPVGGEL